MSHNGRFIDLKKGREKREFTNPKSMKSRKTWDGSGKENKDIQ